MHYTRYEFCNYCKALGIPQVSKKRFATMTIRDLANHAQYWLFRNAGNSHKQCCSFCDDVLPAELTDEFLLQHLQSLAPFPEQSSEKTYAELLRQYEAIIGKPYHKFVTKEKLIAMIAEVPSERGEADPSQMGKEQTTLAGKPG